MVSEQPVVSSVSVGVHSIASASSKVIVTLALHRISHPSRRKFSHKSYLMFARRILLVFLSCFVRLTETFNFATTSKQLHTRETFFSTRALCYSDAHENRKPHSTDQCNVSPRINASADADRGLIVHLKSSGRLDIRQHKVQHLYLR